ncbi:uncharacterized protein LOC141524235 [Cotesia typhae]|uniref:uncharacterized protein LOC141524235 n=1 Tax=Cotesia typhae TaxID=2053667 RepID=UPI003D6872D5
MKCIKQSGQHFIISVQLTKTQIIKIVQKALKVGALIAARKLKEGITSTFKHDYLPLDPEVQEAIKPIYEDLSRYELLDRCKGNNTQNNNESYNGLLWHFSPKHLHNGFKTIELSNNFATAIFNDGYSSILKIFNVMEVIVGPAARDFAALKNDTRIRIADYRQRASSKEGRSSRRKASSAEQALFEEEEGVLYGPGIAD